MDTKILKIKKSSDFEITGYGSSENWSYAEWITIPQRSLLDDPRATRLKILYSGTGVYFLFHCEDEILTSTMDADFMDLWKEDVVEVFLWTDESKPVYFEYEISPLNYELPIIVHNNQGELLRWMPFHYEDNRKTFHATSVQGGRLESHALVSGWTAEFFIPNKLLFPLNNIHPESGTQWRANFYRVDYDKQRFIWSWQLTDKSFHEYKKFGTLVFE